MIFSSRTVFSIKKSPKPQVPIKINKTGPAYGAEPTIKYNGNFVFQNSNILYNEIIHRHPNI